MGFPTEGYFPRFTVPIGIPAEASLPSDSFDTERILRSTDFDDLLGIDTEDRLASFTWRTESVVCLPEELPLEEAPTVLLSGPNLLEGRPEGSLLLPGEFFTVTFLPIIYSIELGLENFQDYFWEKGAVSIQR
jgi:hypothetical protein